MKTAKRYIELLAPAGNFEKLEIAVHYGADAVYLSGKDFSLRNFSGNFSLEKLEQARAFCRERGVRMYVACNIYSRNNEQAAISTFLSRLGDIRPDGVIVADPGIFLEAQKTIPHIPIHISTQANTTNLGAVTFWERLGASRVNLARELTLTEIEAISSHTSVEIEAFIHGAMCISYSGRCLLSSFMEKREGNRGMCCHPCRFNYTVMEEKRPGQYYPVTEDSRGTYIFNSRDLCMLEHLPDMAAAGISSFKIEGRMKGIHYVASVVKVYRAALDHWMQSPDNFCVRPQWLQELACINHRGYCTGFYLGDPHETLPEYNHRRFSGQHVFVGKILENSDGAGTLVEIRNKIYANDTVEVLPHKGDIQPARIANLRNDQDEFLESVNPGTVVRMDLDIACSKNDLLRKTGESWATDRPEENHR